MIKVMAIFSFNFQLNFILTYGIEIWETKITSEKNWISAGFLDKTQLCQQPQFKMVPTALRNESSENSYNDDVDGNSEVYILEEDNYIYPVMALAFVVFSLFFCVLMVFHVFRHEIQDMNISNSWVTPMTRVISQSFRIRLMYHFEFQKTDLEYEQVPTL